MPITGGFSKKIILDFDLYRDNIPDIDYFIVYQINVLMALIIEGLLEIKITISWDITN